MHRQFQAINIRFDEQTLALRTQFEETNMSVMAGQQGQDIRAMKEDLRGIASRLDGIEARFDTQEDKLNQILARLPRQGD